MMLDKERKVKINKELDAYNGKILFPEKVKRAKEMVERGGLPSFITDQNNLDKEKVKA